MSIEHWENDLKKTKEIIIKMGIIIINNDNSDNDDSSDDKKKDK